MKTYNFERGGIVDQLVGNDRYKVRTMYDLVGIIARTVLFMVLLMVVVIFTVMGLVDFGFYLIVDDVLYGFLSEDRYPFVVVYFASVITAMGFIGLAGISCMFIAHCVKKVGWWLERRLACPVAFVEDCNEDS